MNHIWSVGTAVARSLTPAETRLLQLIVRLPLIWVDVLRGLIGARGPASVYRQVNALKKLGLVRAARLPWQPGPCPELLTVTALGLSAAAGGDPAQFALLARRFRLSDGQLMARFSVMTQLGATYDMLSALAQCGPERVRVLDWEEPWRRRVERPTAKSPVWVKVPAWASLVRGEERADYLLLPDLNTFPLRVYREKLDNLLVLRARQDGCLPMLVVATDDTRVEPWHDLLEEVAARRREAPLAAEVLSWDDVRAADIELPTDHGNDLWSPTRLPAPMSATHGADPSSTHAIKPSSVGRFEGGLSDTARKLWDLALRTRPTDRQILWLVSKHPLITAEQVARLANLSSDYVRRRVQWLRQVELLRLIDAEEVGQLAGVGLLEATTIGLGFAAAAVGLTPAAAIRIDGLAGGGPDNPLGARRSLVRHAAHTMGTNRLMATLGPFARHVQADGLYGWDNASAASRGGTRPDGYCACRVNGQPLGFFIEYDRGTMGKQHYLHKLDRYYHYRDSRRFERDFHGYPAILFVTTSNSAENRFAEAARSAAQGRGAELPLLLTCEWRLLDERNPDGLFGEIWRRPSEPFEVRHAWPAEFVTVSALSA